MTENSFAFDAYVYGPAVAELLLPRRECSLGPGQPNDAAEDRLRGLTPAALLDGRQAADGGMAQACLAGLWLYHDYLDESHAISQEIHTPSGSFWHGILHRREGDFDNAKYWFRRVGNHAVFARLRKAAAAAVTAASGGQPLDAAATSLVTEAAWDPLGFVDLCGAASRFAGRVSSPSVVHPTVALCQAIQAREWELLFDHCYRAAGGQGDKVTR